VLQPGFDPPVIWSSLADKRIAVAGRVLLIDGEAMWGGWHVKRNGAPVAQIPGYVRAVIDNANLRGLC
jgi:hypothetical protein